MSEPATDDIWIDTPEGQVNLTLAVAEIVGKAYVGPGAGSVAEPDAIEAAQRILSIPALKARLDMVVVEPIGDMKA